ncbi:uncharacterized protein LOC133291615, partial [Gastrolobium bilobum]|uniref:uncharacterized protein LOC133291615 n=1 Tax=Gastrolobium bilobum TaxID=150636 RepID=UPI002AB273BD
MIEAGNPEAALCKDGETVALTEECSALIQKKLPPKLKDPGSFSIPIAIGDVEVGKALCDLGASINLMPLTVCRALGINTLKDTNLILHLANRSIERPEGVVEDVLVKVDKFIFPVDFVILDMEEEDTESPLLLGRPFLATARSLIDVEQGKLMLRVNEETVTIDVFEAIKHPVDVEDCVRIDIIQEVVEEVKGEEDLLLEEDKSKDEMSGEFYQEEPVVEELEKKVDDIPKGAPKVELKELPSNLKYVFLGDDQTYPAVINAFLSEGEEVKLVKVLKKNKTAMGWSFSDLKGINPSFCTHKILMEEEVKPVRQPQRRLNPTLKEVVRKEVVKLLDAGMIYPFSDSAWVSPVKTVPKKGGMTVVRNENNELIPTRTVTGWRMCVDYRRLNKATRKDHFPIPFLDQMLERLAGHAFYCFLDGYSGYNQIVVAPEDQEKTAFTCPYGIFAYWKKPFGLCNAPTTFQRCMLAIFSDMVERCIEIFMDKFSVFGPTFDAYLENLDNVLKRCQDCNLVLNWEKCHFMVTEGIVLGHKVSNRGIEVDKAKISVIEKLPHPINVKGVRSFLGHTGIYRRFIKDFRKLQNHCASWSKVIVYTDHAALKYLLTKQDAKPRLLRWMLLLQEFEVEIKDKKGVENLVADHLSRITETHLQEGPEVVIKEEFPDEQILAISIISQLVHDQVLSVDTPPWFADFANYRAVGAMPKDFTYQQRKKFLHDVRRYIWDEPYLFYRCSDG